MALDEMAERGANTMSNMLLDGVVKWVESQPPGDKAGRDIYCEHESLSFSRAGIRYQVIDVREYAQQIPSFTTEELQELLYTCFAFFDLATSNQLANAKAQGSCLGQSENE